MIPQSQISKLSNRLLKEQGGRRIPENILSPCWLKWLKKKLNFCWRKDGLGLAHGLGHEYSL